MLGDIQDKVLFLEVLKVDLLLERIKVLKNCSIMFECDAEFCLTPMMQNGHILSELDLMEMLNGFRNKNDTLLTALICLFEYA
jgi:hypothetical protein